MQKRYANDLAPEDFEPNEFSLAAEVYLASEVDALKEAARQYIKEANPVIEKYCAEHGHNLTDDPDYDNALLALKSFL